MAEQIRIQIRLDDGSVREGFSTINRQGKQTAQKLESNFSNATSRIGSQLKFLVGGFLGLQLGRNVVRQFTELETSIAEVETITNDLGKSQAQFRKELIATSTQFGTSAAEQARSFYQIISAGITDTTKATDALTAANKLAVGGLSTVEGSIDILTSVINGYKDANLEASNVADILFGTVRLGKTRVDELQASLGQIIPSANALGVSFEEVSGAIAQITTRGVSTSEAVTQLNAVLTALLRAGDKSQKVLGDNAEAFSLAALRSKGLARFLRDLIDAVGGSETKLQALLGRAEGTKAIINLAGDFENLEKNIRELTNSSGAADTAFQRIAQTTEFQLNVAFAQFNALILQFTGVGSTFNQLIVGTNSALSALNKNATEVVSTIGGLVFALSAKRVLTGFIVGTKAASLAIRQFGIAARAAGLLVSGLNFRVSNFTKVLRALPAVIGTVRFAVKALQGIFFFGLGFVITEVIQKISELRGALGSFEQVLKFVGLTIERGILRTIRNLIEFLAFNAPKVLEFFGISATQTFERISSKIEGVNAELDKYNQKIRQAVNAPVIPDPTSGQGGGQPVPIDKQIKNLKDEIQGLLAFGDAETEFFQPIKEQALVEGEFRLEKFRDLLKQKKDELGGIAKQTGQLIRNGLANGLSAGIQASVRALQQGENAFKAFAKAALLAIGDLAIQLGTFFIAQGIATSALAKVFPPSAIIAAGAGLVALGTLIKGFSGGGLSQGGGGGVSSPVITNPATGDFPPDLTETAGERARVEVNIQGNVLTADNNDLGQRLVEIINDSFDGQNARVIAT